MSSIQSVKRAFQILHTVAQFPSGAPLGEIADLTGLAKSTVSRMLTTLEEVEAVRREPSNTDYWIGPAIAELIAKPSWLATLAEHHLQQLVDESGETATLSVMDGDHLLYITQKSDPNNNIQIRDWSGTHFPTLHVTSPSKLFLAHDAALLQRYLTKPLERFTQNTITDPAQLVAHLNQICSQGYAWVREEFERGLAGVSAPVFGRNGKLVAALSLYGPVFRVPTHANEKQYSDLVVKVANDMTAKLSGY